MHNGDLRNLRSSITVGVTTHGGKGVR